MLGNYGMCKQLGISRVVLSSMQLVFYLVTRYGVLMDIYVSEEDYIPSFTVENRRVPKSRASETITDVIIFYFMQVR
jgi:hypothetical protein